MSRRINWKEQKGQAPPGRANSEKTKDEMTYLERMRILRERSHYSQDEVAAYLGTSQTMYSRYERGENELPVHHVIALCGLYQVSTDYFLDVPPWQSLPEEPEERTDRMDLTEVIPFDAWELLSEESRRMLREFVRFLTMRDTENEELQKPQNCGKTISDYTLTVQKCRGKI